MTTGSPPSVNSDSVLDLEKEAVAVDQHSDGHNHVPPSSLTFVRVANGEYSLSTTRRIRSIPPLAIGFLDLANSGDFAANVFNHVPVPVYAIVLMAIGATVALIMSFVALHDFTCSWKNIKLLREEWACLKSVDADKSAELEISHRDLGTEIFDRAGVDVAMGIGAFLIAIGTYMAIGGANHKVWFASNLLSGYIGNALPALYGICNVGWSVHIWTRAHKQHCAVSKHLQDDIAKQLLLTRLRKTQGHAILTGVVCLVSGALSMVTPTHWWPYPVLLVCGLAFIYSTWVYRHQIGYERRMLKEGTILDEGFLTAELRFLHSTKTAMQRNLSDWVTLQLADMSISDLLGLLVRCDLFDDLCSTLLNKSHSVKHHFDNSLPSTPIDQQTLLNLEKPEQVAEIFGCARSHLEQYGLQSISIRERYLLECLGACLLHRKGDEKDG
ncbi:hypothetical protein QM012_007583 [Aureobasidium pullulans]|uniref:Integral membrane protein n=1 Tax=Aureobasidium pullulans TaxID=5580 RepID=A0ABR0TNB9_AURPU